MKVFTCRVVNCHLLAFFKEERKTFFFPTLQLKLELFSVDQQSERDDNFFQQDNIQENSTRATNECSE